MLDQQKTENNLLNKVRVQKASNINIAEATLRKGAKVSQLILSDQMVFLDPLALSTVFRFNTHVNAHA